MDSDIDTDQEQLSFEPILEVVEGKKFGKEPEYAIVPDAFEKVMAKYEDEAAIIREPIEPFYRNRFFIGSLCAFTGLMLGHFAAEPRVVEKIVEKERPVVTAPVEKPETKLVSNEPIVKEPFRELKDVKEFDAWKPLNGGFPLPPPESRERLAGSITPANKDFSSIPTPEIRGRMPRGPLLPMDPGGVPSSLPDQNGVQEGGPTGNEQNEQTGQETPKANASTEKFVTVSMNGPDPESGQSRLSGIASSLGGTARTFTHMSEEGSIEAQCVLMIVPANKFQEAKSGIEKLGGASFDSEYNGLASRYQGTAQSRFTTRLSKLREKRKDLLVDFLEDAQPVKQITEAIDMESRAVSATRLGGNMKGKVVFLVTLK